MKLWKNESVIKRKFIHDNTENKQRLLICMLFNQSFCAQYSTCVLNEANWFATF